MAAAASTDLVPTEESPSDAAETLSSLAAISLFRSGWNTAAARHAKSVLAEAPQGEWVERVAASLWPDAQERRRHVAWAIARVDRLLRLAADSGHRALTCLDPAYPPLLKTIVDPPLVLWTQGDPALLSTPAVAVVGSRTALPVSIAVAKVFARGLADAGLTVISGMARGVDSAAHVAALEAGGQTVAVIGSGLMIVYPSRNEHLATEIRTKGAIVSELPPDAEPWPSHFPLRNRIISGLALATVVIEAGERSGSLSTATQALEQGRGVCAVPGNILSDHYRGSHRLIKDGARLVDRVEDVLDEIAWARAPVVESTPRKHLQLSHLESNMARGETYSVDNLARKTRRSPSELLAELSVLELSGRVIRTPGGEFTRLTSPEKPEGK